MTPRARRTGTALALSSVAAVGLATLGPSLPGDEGEIAAHSAVGTLTASPSAGQTASAATDPGATADTTATPTSSVTTSAEATAESGPAPVDVSHLPPPPVAAENAQAANSAERRSRTDVGRVIQVRANDVRLLSNGRLLFEAPRSAGPLSLSRLAGFLSSPRWLERSGDTTTIKAAIYLSPGTHLTIGPSDAKTVRMQQTTSGYGGSIYGSGATLTVTGVNVTSWDPATGAPAEPGARRPFIAFNRGSALRFTDATFTALGRTGSGQTGVALYDGRELVALRTTFADNVIGLASVRTGTTRLDRVTARGNAGTGVLVRGRLSARSVTTQSNAGPGLQVEASPSTDIWSVKAERNSGPGVAVRGSNTVKIDAVRANGNGAGLEVARSSRVTVTDTVTTGNAGAGVDLANANTVSVDTTTSVQDGTGLSLRDGGSWGTLTGLTVHSATDTGLRLGGRGSKAEGIDIVDSSSGIVLDTGGAGTTLADARIEGSRIGLRVMAGNRDASITGVEIGPLADAPQGTAPADVGVDLGGHGTTLTGVNVSEALTGYVVRGGADGIALTRATATGIDTGVRVQEGVDGIVLRDITTTGGTTGLDSASSGLVVESSRFTDSVTGAKFTGAATLTSVDVDASECGIRSVGGEPQINGGSVRAPRASCGEADLGDAQVLPPSDPRGLGLFAGAMVSLAIVYESVRAVRERRRRAASASATTAQGEDVGSDDKEADTASSRAEKQEARA
ncbi:MAG: right-handed parallel beta-helix repeat-containing protein [Dermatophilus congolensis]|nr:right-handed parallel beta-helix repeat-containing protein [Dermatophilus congolensis]